MGVSAGHHTMIKTGGIIKPPFDWSYETSISLRGAYANSLPKFNSMPTLLNTTTVIANSSSIFLPLWSEPGSVGIFNRQSASSSVFEYRVFNTETFQYTNVLLTVDFGTWGGYSFSPTIDGQILLVSRYQGKAWRFNEDGTGLEYLGQTNPSFGTNFGIVATQNYDGTHQVFQQDTSNGSSWVINRDGTIVQGKTLAITYPYTFMKIPGYVYIGGISGHITVTNEAMTSTYLANSVQGSSYAASNTKLFIPPGVENVVARGADSRGTTIGLNVSTLAAITTNTGLVTNSVNGCSWGQVFLPNGQLLVYRPSTDNSTNNAWWGAYDWNSNTFTSLATGVSTSNQSRNMKILPTGKILSNYNGNFELYDYGIDKKYTPINLCNGPFGYNGNR